MATDSSRHVEANQIVSPALPPVRITVAPTFTYVGGPRFELYGIALAEQHLFVDADEQQTIQRLVWVQFEGFLPDNQRTYRYPVTETVTLAGTSWIYDISTVTVDAALAERPDSDVAAARNHLQARDYRLPEEIQAQRFVYLIEPDKRDELMIIYAESSDMAASVSPQTAQERALACFSVQFL
jgi:hypothetical protein